MTKFAAAVLLLSGASATGPRCKSQTNTNVDWWIMYKMPVLTTMPTGTAWRNGYGYAYMDSTNPTGGMMPAKPYNTSSLQDEKMMLTYTLEQVYANKASSSVGYYLYNDEKPDGSTSSYRGHTKGVTVFDASGGFFLDHSVPRWPPLATGTYEFPAEEATYGQSFMCVSLDSKALETVYGNWLYTYPNVYSQSIPASLQATYPNLVSVAAGKHVTAAPWTSVVTFNTIGGLAITYLAKYSTWAKDFWEDLVAPTLGVALLTETWQNGVGRLASFCTPEAAWDVENVLSVNLGQGAAFSESKDHSKWAVAEDHSKWAVLRNRTSEGEAASAEALQDMASAEAGASGVAPWACVGDLNMQSGQESRAGGAMCMNNANFHTAYYSLITSVELCPA